ncbi:MAG: histidine kinase [Phycisphaerales bacterium]|nr:histidine kinase [Phycisphaerales bacterium]
MHDLAQTGAKNRSQKASILIVDDRPEKVLALEAVLEDLGQTIVTVNSGREALRQVLHQDFSVILLDVNMPGMDGFETAELIRQRPSSKHVPIIFITAFTDEMHASRGYSLGAVDYIQAPVLPEILRTKVTVFVDLFRKNLQLREQTDSLRHHAEQLQALAAAAVQINSAMSIDQMLLTIVDSARDVLGTHQALLLYLNPSNNGQPRTVSVGSYSERYRDWRGRPLDLATVANTALAKCRTSTRLTDTELRAHADWTIMGNLVIPPITGGMLAAPLCGRDGSNLGLVYVTDPQGDPFTTDDDAMLVQLAQMGSIAIENTLYSQEREANRAKDEFLGTLSHELRTPLNAILGWTELMKDEPMPAEVGHAFEVIGRSARAQATLIEDLLEVSRINSGKLQITARSMDLGGVIEAVVESIRPSASTKGVALQSQSGPLPVISGDPDRLQQVVWNLLSNAVKFTPAGGAVVVTAEASVDSITVQVQDNGLGIGPEFLPHVFERFRQADSSNTRRHGGLGIGLTIVKQIVQLHGGSVSVNSDGAGLGSVFSFTIPFASTVAAANDAGLPVPDATSANAEVSVGAEPSLEGLAGLGIVLVDDDDDAREVLTAVLIRHGLRVSAAASAAEAMQLCLARRPDLIISDISMPDEDGYSFIRRVHAMPESAVRRIPAIALTAHARASDRERTLEAGYNDHVAKPVNPADLITAIRHVMSHAAEAPAS